MHYAHSSYCWCCCYSVVEANNQWCSAGDAEGSAGPPAGCCPESDGIQSQSATGARVGDDAMKASASQAPLVVSLLHDSIGLVEQQQQCMHDSGDRRRKNASSAQYFHSILNLYKLRRTGSQPMKSLGPLRPNNVSVWTSNPCRISSLAPPSSLHFKVRFTIGISERKKYIRWPCSLEVRVQTWCGLVSRFLRWFCR